MNGKNDQTGLCANCLNIKDCLYYEGKEKPVHFCEEYACGYPSASLRDSGRFKRAERMFLPKTNPGLFDDCGRLGKYD